MSKRGAAVAVAVAAAVVALAALGWWLASGVADGTYYVQVDNARTKELESKGGIIDPTGGMSIEYSLPAFDDAGNEKGITFGTERQLRDGAYLKLTAVPIRGVTEWSEVRYDEIPAQARDRLPAPDGAD